MLSLSGLNSTGPSKWSENASLTYNCCSEKTEKLLSESKGIQDMKATNVWMNWLEKGQRLRYGDLNLPAIFNMELSQGDRQITPPQIIAWKYMPENRGMGIRISKKSQLRTSKKLDRSLEN